jgi:hypothetical protein
MCASFFIFDKFVNGNVNNNLAPFAEKSICIT